MRVVIESNDLLKHNTTKLKGDFDVKDRGPKF